MSDPNSSNNNPAGSPKVGGPAGNWRDMRRAERRSRRDARHDMMSRRGGFPAGAIVLIGVGVVFLLGNFGFHLPPHWWAILLLIPAVGLLVAAIRFYRVDSSASSRAVGPAIGGTILLAMALAVFFGLNWGLFWPIVLIIVGLAIIARRTGFGH